MSSILVALGPPFGVKVCKSSRVELRLIAFRLSARNARTSRVHQQPVATLVRSLAVIGVRYSASVKGMVLSRVVLGQSTQ